MDSAVDEQRLGAANAQVKRHCDQATHHPDQNGEGEEVLRLGGQQAEQQTAGTLAGPACSDPDPLDQTL